MRIPINEDRLCPKILTAGAAELLPILSSAIFYKQFKIPQKKLKRDAIKPTNKCNRCPQP
jgi:hypothetical protein